MIPECEFRQRRPAKDGQGEEFVCTVAGDTFLARVGEETSALERVCGACPIPEALRHPRACLYLRPIRFIDDPPHPPAYFACRYFYRLAPPERLPRDLSWCVGCPYWFPRPRLDLIRGHAEEVARIRAYIREGPGEEGWSFSLQRPGKESSLWTRIRLKLFGW